MSAPLTPERLAELREWCFNAAGMVDDDALECMGELLGEVDALRADRDAWVRMYTSSARDFLGSCEAVMAAVERGADVRSLLDLVADWLNERDAVDDESLALYGRARAVADRAAVPTPAAPSPPEQRVLGLMEALDQSVRAAKADRAADAEEEPDRYWGGWTEHGGLLHLAVPTAGFSQYARSACGLTLTGGAYDVPAAMRAESATCRKCARSDGEAKS